VKNQPAACQAKMEAKSFRIPNKGYLNRLLINYTKFNFNWPENTPVKIIL